MTAKDAISCLNVDEECELKRSISVSAPMALTISVVEDSSDVPVAVIDESTGKCVGQIDAKGIVAMMSKVFPVAEESVELTITCRAGQYSASSIAHAVEDVDAHLLNLNVLDAGVCPSDNVHVAIRVGHSRAESVVRSLYRYGYEVVEIAGMSYDLSRRRVDELIHYLEV